MASSRRKLCNNDRICHPVLGKLIIRVTHRDNHIPPDLWEAIDINGKLACPCAFNERGLHFTLKRFSRHMGVYSFV